VLLGAVKVDDVRDLGGSPETVD
jgi:hypothetical protein